MAADELVVNGGNGIVDIERSLFARQLGDEHRLQQKIAELLGQRGAVVAVDGVDDLVRFLDHERFETRQRLLAVPRTAVRAAEGLHELYELVERTLRHGSILSGWW